MTVKENKVLSSGFLSLLVFSLFLMTGCTESPSGRIVSSPDAVTDSLPLICTDTDGGKSYYEKGVVTNGVEEEKIDSCVGEKVREYYCKQDGTIDSQYFNCRNGCRDGACLTELESTTTTRVITRYVCPDRSVVDDPSRCPEEITTNLTTITTTTTLKTTSKTTSNCKSSSFGIGDLVETTPLYESKTGYVSKDSHVEGVVIGAEETESGGCMIRIGDWVENVPNYP